MRHDTYIPCDRLKPYISALAISEAAEESMYKVLPGTGLVIGFQYKGRLSHLAEGKQALLSTAGITGLNDQFRVFQNTADTGSVLVYFKEAGASVFFSQPLHELFRESISLDNFMLRSELLLTEEQLCEATTDAEKITVVEQFLLSRMQQAGQDKLVLAALALIHESKGTIRISELAAQLHTSQSPLEKRFRKAVGASPKKFASVVRLKHAISSYPSQQNLTGLGYEAGFYDQAHFIKEFRRFTGESPETFFAAP